VRFKTKFLALLGAEDSIRLHQDRIADPAIRAK